MIIKFWTKKSITKFVGGLIVVVTVATVTVSAMC